MLLAMIFGLAAAFPGLVRGADGAELLAKLYPSKLHPHVSIYTHVLLFHGLGPTRLRDVPSGRDALAALTDEEVAIRTFGASPFVRTRNGVRYLLQKDPLSDLGAGETHRDQCLATFAALNLPLATPIRLKNHSSSISDLLSESVANFSFYQREPAWTAMAYAKYLAPRKEWSNRFREQYSFSALVQHMLGLDMNKQSCSGTHIFQALLKIECADREHRILDDAARAKLDAYVARTLREAASFQQPDGSWDQRWCKAIAAAPPASLPSRLLVTGHLLETMNDLPPGRSISWEVRMRAAKWLKAALHSEELQPSASFVCPVTHAVKATARVLQAADEREKETPAKTLPQITAAKPQ